MKAHKSAVTPAVKVNARIRHPNGAVPKHVSAADLNDSHVFEAAAENCHAVYGDYVFGIKCDLVSRQSV